MTTDLPSRVKHLARQAGFDLCGIAPVREFRELESFPKWIAAGHHGEMKYMESRNDEGALKRSSLTCVAPWARSVIVCAINYNTAQPYSTQAQDSTRGWISRYAWSQQDYHEAVLRRLRRLEDCIRNELSGTDFKNNLQRIENPPSGAKARSPRALGGKAEAVPSTQPALEASSNHYPPTTNHYIRSYVDTGPIVERVYAKYAGIGWIARNTCIINQKMGSWLFLGVILTSLELEADLPAPDRCGSCTRCIDACPTHAFIAPGQLDARLCISYLTIEKRGEIPEDLRSGMGRHVFGCDICQDVCPWNRKAPVTAAPEFQPREGLVNPALDWLAEMQPEEFRAVFRGSPIRRAKLSGLRRNAVIAMGNSENAKFMPTLRTLSEDPDPVVANHAQWAVQKLRAHLKNPQFS